MHEHLRDHIERALHKFSSEDNYEFLLEAKKEYTEIVGKIFEDDYDFESVINSFYDWYLFQFLSRYKSKTIIKEYIIDDRLGDQLREALTNMRFSLFEYVGKGSGGVIVLYDFFSDRKIRLSKMQNNLALVKSDLFIGRILTYENEKYLLDGVSLLPRELKLIIKKEIKELVKLNSVHLEIKFLFSLEKLKNKWKNYRHINPIKFFEMNMKR